MSPTIAECLEHAANASGTRLANDEEDRKFLLAARGAIPYAKTALEAAGADIKAALKEMTDCDLGFCNL
jgi:hypothetical protein